MRTDRPNLRELGRERRRQRILEAARTQITRGGMDSLTMRRLARDAGLSVTTLYNLFGAREDIVSALVNDAIDHMDEALDRDAPLEDPIERCRAVITLSIRHIEANAAIFRPMLLASARSALDSPHKRNRVSERAARMQAVAIEEAMARGLLACGLDPLQLGRQIYHGYQLASHQWVSGEIDLDGFEARALYGLNVALLGLANASLKPVIEADLRALESRLRAAYETAELDPSSIGKAES